MAILASRCHGTSTAVTEFDGIAAEACMALPWDRHATVICVALSKPSDAAGVVNRGDSEQVLVVFPPLSTRTTDPPQKNGPLNNSISSVWGSGKTRTLTSRNVGEVLIAPPYHAEATVVVVVGVGAFRTSTAR